MIKLSALLIGLIMKQTKQQQKIFTFFKGKGNDSNVMPSAHPSDPDITSSYPQS